MTNTYPRRELLIRLAYFVAGTAITALGASVFILSETGTDPFGMLMQGVAKIAGISNGTAHIAINATYIIIIAILDRRYIRIGTFAALFATGPMIDLASRLLGHVISGALPYFLRLSICLASCPVIGFGLSCVINASVGMGANDLVSVIISDKTHLQFRWVRVGVDAAMVATGYLLGGVIGLGTVACALLTGPCTQFFMPRSALILHRVLSRIR